MKSHSALLSYSALLGAAFAFGAVACSDDATTSPGTGDGGVNDAAVSTTASGAPSHTAPPSPSGTTPLSSATVMEPSLTAVPSNTPVEAGPDDTAAPTNSVPDAATPNSATPDGGAPDSSVPDGGVPDSSTPESSIDSGILTDSSVPPDSSALPDSATSITLPTSSVIVPDGSVPTDGGAPEEADPAQIQVGERLFLESRFAEYFYANFGNDVNAPLTLGDPVLDYTPTLSAQFDGPFAGQSMNCSACHLVDQHLETVNGGMRTYADFARRSPIPVRNDGLVVTPRNSPPLVNASRARDVDLVLHFDGEFPTMPALVEGTLTGRNYGWLPTEGAVAKAHIAQVLREDDGTSDLAAEFGSLSYSVLLTGTDPLIPADLVLPEEFRVDVATATDAELLEGVKHLIAAYVDDLAFAQDEEGNYTLSPYDTFLKKNSLPTQPDNGESSEDYGARLLTALNALNAPVWVGAEDGSFAFHNHDFVFGQDELNGLKIFLSSPAGSVPTQDELDAGGFGNCVACHAPPHFTDFGLHNTGATQLEYDSVHGDGGFSALSIPDLTTRDADYDSFLPPTAAHPNASGVFRSIPDLAYPQQTDLGVWNILLNPDQPGSDTALRSLLCTDGTDCSTDDATLQSSIARFKTSGLRDLGHSAPYLHTGEKDTVEDVIDFYIDSAELGRASTLRNGDPQLTRIALVEADVAPLAAFLLALDEDYE